MNKNIARHHSIWPTLQLSSRKQVVADSLAQLQSRKIHGHASTSAVSRDTGIPQSSVARIFRSLGMHRYKMTLCQEITDTDKTARMNLARWINDNENSLEKIVWSDEADFTLDGAVNRHNCVIWPYENPHVVLTKGLFVYMSTY